ncbi:MAG: phosphatidylserine decarboxylase family protein [Chloroherpetonaceae bacterium]|nr:phosphatidylserine decarboxylase family protein [Chloroherpetonaceae bacterium]MDW8438035.1 phosphatidylserine decarboxylase family protein [Chloroherpetonaceae bacterium]
MKLTPYGYGTLVKTLLLCAALLGLSGVPNLPSALSTTLVLLSLGIFAFALQFFRDPERSPPSASNVVVAPADGKVVLAREVEHSAFGGKAQMVSIFMSPFNVHVNRNPISGKVVCVRRIDGQYVAAFADDAGERNERAEILLENDRVKVFFKQIAGYVARRVVCDLKEGDSVVMGERFGMIKFGSRVDLFLPPNVELKVKVGDKTVAGETIIATYS